MGELQRRASSPYISHARSTPPLQFSQIARSTAPPESLVAAIGENVTAGDTHGLIRMPFPAGDGRFGGHRPIPPISLLIPLTIPSIPPVPQVPIQSGYVVPERWTNHSEVEKFDFKLPFKTTTRINLNLPLFLGPRMSSPSRFRSQSNAIWRNLSLRQAFSWALELHQWMERCHLRVNNK